MHAIIRKGNGGYYTTADFGYYSDDHAEYNYGVYYIVFDESKEHLIKQQKYDPKKKPQLELMVLIVDLDETGWQEDEYGFGGVEFLPKEEALRIVREGICPGEILLRCRDLDDRYHYSEYSDIVDDSDIERLMTVSGWFHDAVIKKLQETDGGLRVLFDGVWGCKIEMFLESDVKYNIDSRDPEQYDPYWDGASMIRQDGYIYFVDDEDIKVEDIGEGYCWFRAKKIRYRIIPN